jgi:RNA polymerase sigma factor (sigma-70 family)
MSTPAISAFHELYRDEFAFVWATARRLGVPPAILEDVVQDVFLTAFRRLDQLRFEVSARAWLHGVTRKIAARHRRTAARLSRRLAALASAPRSLQGPPQDRLAAAQQLDRLLTRLGERTRTVFEMAELLGMSGPEIAGELGIPVSTVYSRVRIAREQLVRELGQPRLEHELDAARSRDAPPPAAAQRAWLVLLPGLGTTTASAGLGALVSARVLVMTTMLLGIGVGALAWPRTPPTAVPTQPRPPSTATSTPVLSPSQPPSRADDPPPPAPTTPPAARRPSDADRLAAEVAVLDRARAELAAGSDVAATARLDEHARRFPDGALADLRGATEVEVLCHQGKPLSAAARAAALLAAFPRSAVAQRFTNFSCPE